VNAVAIARADVAERTRRFAFLLTIIAALYGGYLYVPDRAAHYVTVAIDGHRGLYDSAWLGCMTAVLSAAFLTLAGFFLVRGAALRDWELGTNELVTSSPVRKWTFLFGKFASNFTVLAAVAAVMYAAALVTQLVRGESRSVDLLAYLLPLALVTLPSLALVAAIALLFDVVRPLRGVVGAVAYFVLWNALLIVPLQLSHEGRNWAPYDAYGTTVATAAMTHSLAAVFGEKAVRDIEIGGGDVPAGGLKTFAFGGIRWSVPLVANRVAWLLAALLLVALAALVFDRFGSEPSQRAATRRRRFDAAALVPNVTGLRLYRAELALLLNGQSLYWSLGAVAVAIAGATLPLQNAITYVLPIAMIWPIERWSALGCREQRWHVADFLGCVPRPVVRATFAQWAAAVAVGAALCAGFLFRLAAAGNWFEVAACLAALGAIAAAAIACGVITGSPRLFEGVYLVLWYLGPVNHLPDLDFVNAIVSAPLILLTIAVVVLCSGLVVTIGGRMRQTSR
jgi:hypothetical protein